MDNKYDTLTEQAEALRVKLQELADDMKANKSAIAAWRRKYHPTLIERIQDAPPYSKIVILWSTLVIVLGAVYLAFGG